MPQGRLPASAFTTLGAGGPRVSRAGFGCYRVDDRVAEHRGALTFALRAGVNLIDTSTNYADGHSEILVGKVLKELAAEVPRGGVVIVTKAGYVQGTNQHLALERIRAGKPWSEMTEYSPDCWHCIAPDFLKDQLTMSLARLSMPKVDVMLLHNPEYFLDDAEHRGLSLADARDAFYDRVRRGLEELEEEVTAGRLGAYGISSNTFVAPHDRPDAVDLTRILAFAGPGFKVIQLPMNPLELGARQPIHTPDGLSVLDVARGAGLGVLVNRPFNAFSGLGLVRFAPLASLNNDVEKNRVAEMAGLLEEAFGDPARAKGTISQRTLRGLLATPGVDVALIGMRTPSYVRDVLGAF